MSSGTLPGLTDVVKANNCGVWNVKEHVVRHGDVKGGTGLAGRPDRLGRLEVIIDNANSKQ